MILLRVIEIYKDFLDYICKTDIRKRYFLIKGINSIPQINFFSYHFLSKKFILGIELIPLIKKYLFLISDLHI